MVPSVMTMPVTRRRISFAGRQGQHEKPKDQETELCKQRLLSNFVEWCETRREARPGLAKEDGCWTFDGPRGALMSVQATGRWQYPRCDTAPRGPNLSDRVLIL